MISNFETFEQWFNLLSFNMFQFIWSVTFAFAQTLIDVFIGMIVVLIAGGKALLFHLIKSIFEFRFRAKPPKEPPDKRNCNATPSYWTRLIVKSFGISFLMGSMQINLALENHVKAQNFEIDCWPFACESFASSVNAKTYSHSFGCDLIDSITSLYWFLDWILEPYESRFHLNCGFHHKIIADSSFSNLQTHSPVKIPARPRPF